MQKLCTVAELDATNAKSVSLQHEGHNVDLMVVRNPMGIFAYIDRCPHAGTPLEWQADHFFEPSGEHLMCATHGARFQVHDGLCVDGPCLGQSLSSLPLDIRDGDVFLNLA